MLGHTKIRRNHIALIYLVLITNFCLGQSIVDSCFTSVDPSIDFISSGDLANMGSDQADVIKWTGSEWIGGWPHANLTISPMYGCRAIFIGNGISWTSDGEGFGLRLDSPLVQGQTYSFDFNYVSHGAGSDGVFSPRIYTSSLPNLGYLVGSLPAVGYTWETNTFSFTATFAQAGHTWIIITTAPNGSSGIVNSFCIDCYDTNCSVDLGDDMTLCQGDSLILSTLTSNASYLWQDNSTNPTYTVSQQGTYWVTVMENNCSATDTININYSPLPVVDLGDEIILCQGESLILSALTSNATYQWQDNSTNPTYTVSQPGIYWVTTTVNNCGVTNTINIEYEDCEIILEMPNVFSPNKDGINDYFLANKINGISQVTLIIFNRWGQYVFETNDMLTGWDGTYNGQECAEGVYFWNIQYTTIANESETLTGFLTLVR